MHSVSSLVASGIAEIYVRSGTVAALIVAAEYEEDLAMIKTKLDRDSLEVGTTPLVMTTKSGTMHFHGSIGSISGGTVFVNGVQISPNGANISALKGRVVVGVVVPALETVSLTGSTDITILDIEQERMTVKVSGAGNVRANGRVTYLNAKISGAGAVKGKNLIADQADLKVSGAGKIKVFVSEKVDAKVSGVGSITVLGNPSHRQKNVSGVGSVKFK